MDFTPPSHRSEPRSRTKSASRLDAISKTTPSPSPSPSIQDLLLLSSSTHRKSRSRLVDRFEMNDEVPEGGRRRTKTRAPQMGLLGCASPRSVRRSRRRRSEAEIREERDLCLGDEFVKVRKRRQSGRSNKENLSLVPLPTTPTTSTPKLDNDENGGRDRIGQLITDLIMWKDGAKSSLWFGLGSLFFLSSSFASRGVSFSIFSAISQLGLLILGLAFVSNSICQRNNVEKKHNNGFKVKEDDILHLVKLILPSANFAISKITELFCGDAEMTLKVAPFLILGAEFGHLITLRRLCTIAFFTSFSLPKLYSCYQIHINTKVDVAKRRVSEAWRACPHKKFVVGSAATLFWNFSSLKTRIFSGFITLVMVKYCQKFMVVEPEVVQEEDENQALVLVGGREE